MAHRPGRGRSAWQDAPCAPFAPASTRCRAPGHHAVDRPGAAEAGGTGLRGAARRAGGARSRYRRSPGVRLATLVRSTCSSTASTSENWRRLNESSGPSADQPAAVRHLSHRLDHKPFVRSWPALELGKTARHRPQCPIRAISEFGGQNSRNAGGSAYGMTDM